MRCRSQAGVLDHAGHAVDLGLGRAQVASLDEAVDMVWAKQDGHLPIAAFFQSPERLPHKLDTGVQVSALDQNRAPKGLSDVSMWANVVLVRHGAQTLHIV